MKIKSVWIVLLCACCFSEEAVGGGSSEGTSGESSEGDESSTMGTSESASSGSDSGSDESDGSGSDSAGESESDSTGEPPGDDFALSFDSTSYATTEPVNMPLADFTIEAWVEILGIDATGLIVDFQDDALQNGWTFFIHPDSHTLVISFFDDQHVNQVAVGPAIADIGVGWHHLAATKAGTVMLLHVDGAANDPTAVSVNTSTAYARLSIGGNINNNPVWSLHNAIIDDVRISGFPRYDMANFDPPVVFEAEGTTILIPLDEGKGTIANDMVAGLSLDITNPTWVAGYAG